MTRPPAPCESLHLPRFFSAEPLRAGARQELGEEVVRHAIHAARLRQGDALVLFDGSGGEFSATIAEVAKRGVFVDVAVRRDVERESPFAVTLLQALPAGDKMDWIIQKTVELGVARIVPVACERSVLRLSGERAEKRREHWQRVAISACEQCGRNRVPEVAPISRLADALSALPAGEARWLLHPDGGKPLADLPAPAALSFLVGPEGGFSDAELAAASAAGFSCATLGPRVLRTETAAPAMLAVAQALWGDFRQGTEI